MRPAPAPVTRGPFRRYLEARGVLGRIDGPHLTARLRASDGVALEGSYLQGPAAADTAVLLAHGFAANRRKPAYARLASALSEIASVLTLDLRGHGASAGACTLGDAEARDIEAAVGWLRGFGHGRVVAIGVSMGATAVLHAVSGQAVAPRPRSLRGHGHRGGAALHGEVLDGVAVDGIVTVSAPGWFHDPPETLPLQRLHGVWISPARRRALRVGLGITLDGPAAWTAPRHPVEMAERVKAPYLAIHGRDDPYFPASDAEALARAVGGKSSRWLEPDSFGHAEDGFAPAFNRRLASAVAWWASMGEFPSRRESLDA